MNHNNTTITKRFAHGAGLWLGILLLAFAVQLIAHGGFEHVVGTVVKVENNVLTVKAAKGNVDVRLNEKTEITRTDQKAEAADLKRAFPDMKGFSPRNLKYMRAFAEAWPDEAFVQAVRAQITWYHNLAILEKLAVADARVWYAKATIQHGSSRNVLVHQIE